jgi:predicted Zn-dependent protease with MMP-like domain
MIASVIEIRVQKKFDRARQALDDGALSEARKHAEEGIRILEKESDPLDPNLLAEGLAILGMILTDQQAFRDAERAYKRLRKVKHSNPEAHYSEACYRLARWEFDKAAKLLAKCREADGLQASALDLLALLARYRGRKEEAGAYYREAACHDPDRCPMPVEMTDDEALALVDAILRDLPETVRDAIDNIDIQLVDLPDPKLDASDETNPEILGLYHGVPIPERSVFDPHSHPDRIRIFKHNIERIAWDRDHMLEELRTTLLHEIGHHLGWDEEDLAERGLA